MEFANGERFSGMNLAPTTPLINASRFDVNPLSGVEYNPVVTPPTWFHTDTIGNTFYCYSSTVCSSPPPAMADTTIRDLIESGILIQKKYQLKQNPLQENTFIMNLPRIQHYGLKIQRLYNSCLKTKMRIQVIYILLRNICEARIIMILH